MTDQATPAAARHPAWLAPLRSTPLRRIATPLGDVMHGLRRGDPGDAGFGEAYFSWVHDGAVKGWKRHRQMTLNLVCVAGCVRVVVHDGESLSAAWQGLLSPATEATRCRLTVPPGWWVAFQGRGSGDNLLMNLANLPHDPAEAETAPLARFAWPWEADA